MFLIFFSFLVASSMGFKPFLAACHIFTICIVVCFCNVVANKVLSLSYLGLLDCWLLPCIPYPFNTLHNNQSTRVSVILLTSPRQSRSHTVYYSRRTELRLRLSLWRLEINTRDETTLACSNYTQCAISLLVSVFRWDQRQTKRLNFGLSPELRLTNQCSASSLTSSVILPYFFVYFSISEKVNRFSPIKT